MLPIIPKLNTILRSKMCEHLGISKLTWKKVKGNEDSVIKKRLLFWNDMPDFEDFSILTNNNGNFKVT